MRYCADCYFFKHTFTRLGSQEVSCSALYSEKDDVECDDFTVKSFKDRKAAQRILADRFSDSGNNKFGLNFSHELLKLLGKSGVNTESVKTDVLKLVDNYNESYLQKIDQKKSFEDLLTSVFTLEQNFDTTLVKIQDTLDDSDYSIPFNTQNVRKIFSRHIDLFVSRALASMVGNAAVLDEITTKEISRLFGEAPADPKLEKVMKALLQKKKQARD